MFFANPRSMSDSHSVSSSISVCALAGRMQSLCKQVINGSEHCSYGEGKRGGASLEQSRKGGKRNKKF